jgi:hypothetical protein
MFELFGASYVLPSAKPLALLMLRIRRGKK